MHILTFANRKILLVPALRRVLMVVCTSAYILPNNTYFQPSMQGYSSLFVCVPVCVCPVEISFYVHLHKPCMVPTVYKLGLGAYLGSAFWTVVFCMKFCTR